MEKTDTSDDKLTANLRKITKSTLDILEQGYYMIGNSSVNISEKVAFSQTNTILYTPDMLYKLVDTCLEGGDEQSSYDTVFRFENSTTLSTARALVDETSSQASPQSDGDVLILNFASGKRPGGGFLTGGHAQEESLTRSSSLYSCINQHHTVEFYKKNRKDKTGLFTHHIIYSPNVVFFRNDSNGLVDKPICCSVITCPAVHYRQAKKRVKEFSIIPETMRERADRILSVALHHKHQHLILGAWGCGAFGNKVYDVAKMFSSLLFVEGSKYYRKFKIVTFAVTDSFQLMDMERYFYNPELSYKPQPRKKEKKTKRMVRIEQNKKARELHAKTIENNRECASTNSSSSEKGISPKPSTTSNVLKKQCETIPRNKRHNREQEDGDEGSDDSDFDEDSNSEEDWSEDYPTG
eukprot:TRINITY_DN200_c0_g1_i10.p1 TRINITY_DN200_c0_g1~~TRINITY_DN200_c0_g1_i10.p1  ORF type:complete len:409 (-),score=61.05 TRINITY_DN200_c0_g1_i10:1123-2349(-)